MDGKGAFPVQLTPGWQKTVGAIGRCQAVGVQRANKNRRAQTGPEATYPTSPNKTHNTTSLAKLMTFTMSDHPSPVS